MKRRMFMAALAATLAAPALAQELSLGQISAYMNSFATATGEFTQINADGTLSTGRIYLKRPGRIRFEYNPPEAALVLASAGSLAVFDPKSNTGPERYPVDRTPLKIILERSIDLGRENMVTGHVSDGTRTTVTAQDPAHPEYGNIQLVFTGAPTQLRQWIVTDDSGQQTTVILGDLQTGVQIPNNKFNIIGEIERRQTSD